KESSPKKPLAKSMTRSYKLVRCSRKSLGMCIARTQGSRSPKCKCHSIPRMKRHSEVQEVPASFARVRTVPSFFPTYLPVPTQLVRGETALRMEEHHGSLVQPAFLWLPGRNWTI